jgi:hypothetical protein
MLLAHHSCGEKYIFWSHFKDSALIDIPSEFNAGTILLYFRQTYSPSGAKVGSGGIQEWRRPKR